MTQESKITADQKQAIDRLLQVAARGTGQSKRVADFLLAWWNAEECGGFDLTDMWPVDPDIRGDMLTVISFIASSHGIYPDALGYKEHFRNLISEWRPRLDCVLRAILEIRDDGKDISIINVLSVSEQCAVALATASYDHLPKPYQDRLAAWERLDARQRAAVVRFNSSFDTDQWRNQPLKY